MVDEASGQAFADRPRFIEGRIARKLNNALTLSFHDGPGDPFGTAVQGGADGFGRRMGVLFGFKNGGVGVHVYTPAVGPALHVESRDREPTLLTREDDQAVGQIQRGPVCTGTDAAGQEILRWIDHPDGAKTPDAFRLHVTRPDGAVVAHLDVIRTLAGWSLGRELAEDLLWFGHAGQPLKLPFLGTSVRVFAPLSPLEEEMLLASCLDTAIGLRPYGTGMG